MCVSMSVRVAVRTRVAIRARVTVSVYEMSVRVLRLGLGPRFDLGQHLSYIIKERKGFPAEIFDWSRAEVSA